MGTRKRILVVVCVVAALGGAGVAGAVVVGNTIGIGRGQWAHLEGTKIYCEAYYERDIGVNGFDCGYWAGSNRVGKSYSMVVDDLGVEIDRWDASGRHYKKVRTFVNP